MCVVMDGMDYVRFTFIELWRFFRGDLLRNTDVSSIAEATATTRRKGQFNVLSFYL